MSETALESAEKADFDESPEGQARRWSNELTNARKALAKFQSQGHKVVAKFLDEPVDAATNPDSLASSTTNKHLPLFTSNTQTQRAIMYGQAPKGTVTRKFADAKDDTARVAAEMMERLLNSDIERADDTFAEAIGLAMQDRQLPGLGVVRGRYVAQFEEVTTEAIMGPGPVDPMTGMPGAPIELAPEVTKEKKVHEDAEVFYEHWMDCLWSPARVPSELRWFAFKALMTRDEAVERFGSKAKRLPLNSKGSGGASSSGGFESDTDKDARNADPWARIEVWEIWSKELSKVFWYVDGHKEVLDSKDDPLGLDGFWPFPRPMMANLTTSKLVPKADYVLVQDIYEGIDTLTTRIDLLEECVRVAGVYDKTQAGLARLINGKAENVLVPVENWQQFTAGGGMRGVIDWVPLDQVVNALTQLRDLRREKIDLAYQVSGMSDIMRGQATTPGVTATEQRIKAQFGSVRMTALQDEFARFASDALAIKCQIIRKHFDPETIIKRSNVMMTEDAPLAQAAVQLIKSEEFELRVEVKQEALSLRDFSTIKTERAEMLNTVGNFVSLMSPVIPMVGPEGLPLMLKLLQAAVAGLRGASAMESVLDQAVSAAEQAAKRPPAQNAPPPDPKIALQAMKSQADLVKIDKELQADLMRNQAEVAGDAQREATQREQNVLEAAAKAQVAHAFRPVPTFKPFGGNGTGGVL